MEAAIAAAAVAFATAIGSLYVASRLGLSGVQKAASEERQVLVSALKDRISILEAENRALRVALSAEERKREAQVATLELEVKRLSGVVDSLMARKQPR